LNSFGDSFGNLVSSFLTLTQKNAKLKNEHQQNSNVSIFFGFFLVFYLVISNFSFERNSFF